MVDTLTREHRERRVLVVAHQVTVMHKLCAFATLERMTESQVLALDRERDVANCGVAAYRFDVNRGPLGQLFLETFNFVAPLVEAGETVTTGPDVPAGRWMNSEQVVAIYRDTPVQTVIATGYRVLQLTGAAN